jgi:UDP-N-acetylmuramoyl-tripeptide--D-alanyl-D-alanine ligase
MKNFIKNTVLSVLMTLARIRLKRLRLFIVGVTGSIGKTSVKDAIYLLLEKRFRAYKSKGNYNTEFGLPLAILEQKSGFSSPLKWLRTMAGSVWSAFFGGRHMQMLILEMGVDKPGDMDYLLKVVQPQIGVMTHIKPVHMGEGQFKNLDDIFLEKRKLIDSLPEKGIAILNADDPYVVSLKDHTECRKFLYGASEIADLRLLETANSLGGLEFTVSYKDNIVNVKTELLGSFQVYVLLPAIAVALTQGFTLEEAAEILKDYRLPPGRMNPIPGIKDTLIIDSSYNASPDAVKNALDLLSESRTRKVAVLGNMNELGSLSQDIHREIGQYVVGKADVLLTVGDEAQWIYDEAQKSGFREDMICHFGDANAAAEFLQKIIRKHDTILVKGSQNKVRLERLVKKIMQEPERAQELLVRQGSEWKYL